MDSPTGPAERAHLADLVAASAARIPEHPAIVDVIASGADATVLTWADVDAAVSAESARLHAAGVEPGDRVGIRLPNSAALCVALLGAFRAGAVAVPCGPAAVARELEIVFGDCRPTVVIAPDGDGVAATATAASEAALLGPPDLDARAALTSPVGDGGGVGGGPGGEDIALLLYTSGTTGTPRGVQLSHRALLANRDQVAELRPSPITPVDRVLLALPMFHIYGLAAGFLQACRSGATVVVSADLGAAHLADLLVDQRVSVLAGLPSTFRSLLDLPADRLRTATAGVRLCTSGGAALPPPWLAEFRTVTGLPIVEGYGLTEAGPVVTSNAVGGGGKPGSVGRALPGIELRLVDAAGRPFTAGADDEHDDGGRGGGVGGAGEPVDLAEAERGAEETTDGKVDATAAGKTDAEAAGKADRKVDKKAVRTADLRDDFAFDDDPDPAHETGLVALRGPNLFSGYWPDGAGGPDASGWFRTADVGFLDADGDLHLVDRSSDLVIVNGFSVYPREVEQVLVELAGVAEAAVVGVPDDRTGEAVKAVLVPAAGATLSEQAVRDHCVERLARFKVPTVIEFSTALPRTPTGKIARRQLAGQS